jgi:hypothetical protein
MFATTEIKAPIRASRMIPTIVEGELIGTTG